MRKQVTPETQFLADLLGRYTRRSIARLIQEATDPQDLEYRLRDTEPSQSERGIWAGSSDDRVDTSTGVGSLVGFFDESFPDVLRAIPDPPLVLAVMGDVACLHGLAIAIVGARRCTKRGAELAQRFAGELGAAGLNVVSGLALGVDAAAHNGALAAQARTTACLGAGLRCIYPKSHETLARRIVSSGGALVTEYADNVEPRPYHFPQRNRLISGLSQGVMLVEAGDKSGSLITARMALEQGRDVFALPGPIDSSVSRGCHRLIREGAELIVSSAQVLETLGIDVTESAAGAATLPLQASQEYLLGLLSGHGQSIDDLLELSGWSHDRLAAELSAMELLGIVRLTTDGYIASPLQR